MVHENNRGSSAIAMLVDCRDRILLVLRAVVGDAPGGLGRDLPHVSSANLGSLRRRHCRARSMDETASRSIYVVPMSWYLAYHTGRGLTGQLKPPKPVVAHAIRQLH